MKYTHVYHWLKEGPNRTELLLAMQQPMTAKQIAHKTGIPMDTCRYLMVQCADQGLLTCLNPAQRNSRLYGLTTLGITSRKQLYQELSQRYKEYYFPDIDWSLYGWVCFNHRAAVIRTLSGPMQPAEIKRVLRLHQSRVKISANNIRDIVKLLTAKNIVQPVRIKKKAHLRYELTDIGIQLQRLLKQIPAD